MQPVGSVFGWVSQRRAKAGATARWACRCDFGKRWQSYRVRQGGWQAGR